MKPFAPKVLYIGLDAASRDLVLDWCQQGLMPNLQALRNRSAWAFTQNAPAVYTGSLWPTVWTGTRPGRHACYYNEQLIPGTYKTGEFLGPDVKQEPFWNSLSRAGCRVGLFDVPKAPLCETLNGVQIVDWGTHDSEVPACSWPPQLIEEITETHGAPTFRRCDWVMDGKDPEQTLREQLLQRIATRLAIARDLLQRETWDLFMIGFGESHCIGHQCWHLHDPSHPKHDPALLRRIGDPVRDVYLALDNAVGQLLEYADASTTVVLHCSHGMSAHYDATYLLDRALRRLEGRPQPAVSALLARARMLWKRLPLRLTERFGNFARTVHQMPDASDRASRDCFVVPTNANSAGIRLNLAGREPSGRIQPGKEADEFISSLTTDLQAFTDPSDGRKLVKEVIRSSNAFPGEHSDALPDLFVRWNRDKPITGLASPKIGSLIEEDHSTRRSGDHRPGGLIFLHGPGYAAGTQLPDVHDEDIAPTLAAFLDINLAGVDGRPILPLTA